MEDKINEELVLNLIINGLPSKRLSLSTVSFISYRF